MLPGLTLNPRAVEDIRGILDWMKDQGSLSRGRKLFDAIENSFEILVDSPYLGSPLFYPLPEMHSLRRYQVPGFRDHGIFYRPLASGNGVIVLRVLHARQDDFARLEESLEDLN